VNDPYNDMKYLYLNIQIMTIIIVVKIKIKSIKNRISY